MRPECCIVMGKTRLIFMAASLSDVGYHLLCAALLWPRARDKSFAGEFITQYRGVVILAGTSAG